MEIYPLLLSIVLLLPILLIGIFNLLEICDIFINKVTIIIAFICYPVGIFLLDAYTTQKDLYDHGKFTAITKFYNEEYKNLPEWKEDKEKVIIEIAKINKKYFKGNEIKKIHFCFIKDKSKYELRKIDICELFKVLEKEFVFVQIIEI